MIAPPALSSPPEVDSDSDWDDDDDFASKKINIRIKPVAQVTPGKISASVDELRATVGTWKSLANINLVKPNSRRHHQSTVQLNNIDQQHKSQQSHMLVPSATSSFILPERMAVMENGGLDFNSNGHLPFHRHTINFNGLSPSTPMSSSTKMDQVLDLDNLSSGPDLCQGDQYRHSNNEFTNLNKIKTLPILPLNGDLLQATPSSGAILSPGFHSDSPNNKFNNATRSNQFPVAFAIQECINSGLIKGKSSTSLIGRLKMAVPPNIVNQVDVMKHNLVLTLVTSIPWEKISLNGEFVEEEEMNNENLDEPLAPASSFTKKLSINMKSIQDYTKKQNQINQVNPKYFILPELLKYTIGSQDKKLEPPVVTNGALEINPLNALAHWLCDLDVTKVRVDMSSITSTLSELNLTTDDIRNLKIIMNVNGGVVSYQSKPEAHWNPLSSTLTWSFSTLTELVQESTLNNVTSCLARFDLRDGPSTPSDIIIQFGIIGKTISGTHIILDDPNFRLSTQKLEVRTGIFKCEPPCH